MCFETMILSSHLLVMKRDGCFTTDMKRVQYSTKRRFHFSESSRYCNYIYAIISIIDLPNVRVCTPYLRVILTRDGTDPDPILAGSNSFDSVARN